MTRGPHIADWSRRELAAALAGPGLLLRTGPFVYRLHSRLPDVIDGIAAMYADFESPATALADYHLRVDRMPGIRGHWRPQVNAWLDGFAPFMPLPLDQGYALLEWAMNFCVAGHAHHYLLLHAACLERDGRCLILPGEPGAGKSTLTAALMLSGWRLLSDEITLVDRDTGALHGLARPVSLKNASLDVIRARAPEGHFGRVAHDTHKGTVGHLRASAESVAAVQRTGRAAQIVFPRWQAGAAMQWQAQDRALAFEVLARNGFNYSLLGRLGFEMVESLIDACGCWQLHYSQLDEALPALERLIQTGQP